MIIDVTFLILLYLFGASGAKILAVIPTPSYSHQLAFRPIWRELLARGHHITLLTTDPIRNSTLKNFREINLHYSYEIYDSVFPNIVQEKNFLLGFYNGAIMINEIVDAQLSHRDVKKLIEDPGVSFDLVMIEYSYPALFSFKHRFNCSFIGLSSFDAMMQAHEAVGNPVHPVLYPDYLMPFLRPASLFDRMYSTSYHVFIKLYDYFVLHPIHDLNVKKHFGENYPSVSYLMETVDFMFINTNPIFHNVRPLMPNVVQFGGGRNLDEIKPLDKDLTDFLDKFEVGFIYFNLGTNVKSQFIPEYLMNILMNVFASLPYGVLWKYENESFIADSQNVKMRKWFPQQDILRHKNIKLFITQGGIQSMEEAVHSEVPMIAIPFFGEQFANAQKMHEMGYGYYLNSKHITEDYLRQVIYEVIQNKKYREKVTAIAKLVRDQIMPGTERVVWWTEYILRHENLDHLKYQKIPTYQYYLIDLFVVISVLTFLTYYIFNLIILDVIARISMLLKKFSEFIQFK